MFSTTWRELRAVLLCLMAFRERLSDSHIVLHVDSLSALYYLRNGGGRFQHLTDVAAEVWGWCVLNRVTFDVEHVLGTANYLADVMSRPADRDSHRLRRDVFEQLNEGRHGGFTLDGMVSALNSQCPKFYSRYHDPRAAGVDFFDQELAGENVYLNPPFCLVERCLRYMREQRCKGTLVVPKWSGSTWWRQLMAEAISVTGLPETVDLFSSAADAHTAPAGKVPFKCVAVVVDFTR
jgi:hypothetical protein